MKEWMEMQGRLSGKLLAALLAVLLLAGGMNVSKGESQMEIPITDIRPVRIGQAENTEAGTGCTVLICENGMAAGLDVRGGGPASRESQLLNPLMAAQTNESLYSCGWLLDIARCICTLRTGDVTSKTQAGIRALEEHLFPDEAPLRKTVEIRQDPQDFRDRNDVKQWLKGLGPVVQQYADVLEAELRNVTAAG